MRLSHKYRNEDLLTQPYLSSFLSKSIFQKVFTLIPQLFYYKILSRSRGLMEKF